MWGNRQLVDLESPGDFEQKQRVSLISEQSCFFSSSSSAFSDYTQRKKKCAAKEEEKALQALESHSFLSTSENKYIFVSCARCCHRNFFSSCGDNEGRSDASSGDARRRKKQGRKRPKWAAVIITRGDFHGKNCACQFLSKIDRHKCCMNKWEVEHEREKESFSDDVWRHTKKRNLRLLLLFLHRRFCFICSGDESSKKKYSRKCRKLFDRHGKLKPI